MNSTFLNRGSNVPYAFNPGSNAGIATGVSSIGQPSTTEDRLIVGVDFGTTYSGMLYKLYVQLGKRLEADRAQVLLPYIVQLQTTSTSSRHGRAGTVC